MEVTRPAFDTSVLLAALQSWHTEHERSVAALDRALDRGAVIVPVHVLFECYSVLTRLPRRLRLAPKRAREVLDRTLGGRCRIAEVGEARAFELLRRLAEADVSGGAVYDALIAHAAFDAGAESIVTLNPRDFERLAPDGLRVVEP